MSVNVLIFTPVSFVHKGFAELVDIAGRRSMMVNETGAVRMAMIPGISADAHCARVAGLAKEVGRRMSLGSKSIHNLEQAALLHHADLDSLNETQCRPNRARLGSSQSPRGILSESKSSVEVRRTLEDFHGGVTASGRGPLAVLPADILQLANAFDENFEWRVFDYSSGREIFEELGRMTAFEGWSPAVYKAFTSISEGNRDQALAKSKCLPISTVSRIQKLALSNNEDLTIDSLEQMALHDPVVSADLLRHANSAKHYAIGCVGSVRQAIMNLGTVTSRDVLLASAARGFFASSSLRNLWDHSLRCANTMKVVALKAGLDQNRAFLLGLLHDIGRISLECLDPVSRIVQTRLSETQPPAIWSEIVIAGCDHAELGAEILDWWNFPESITDGIRNHHSPELSCEKLTSLLYLVESTERADEDLPSASRFETALSTAGMTKGQFEDAYLGPIMQIAC